MNMGWLESFFYGMISGISEFIPISSNAHQRIAMLLFGVEQRDPVRDFVVHIALVFALYYSFKPMLEQLQRERRQRHSRNQHGFVSRSRMDLRLIKSATLPMLVSLIVLTYIFSSLDKNLLAISGLFLLNGLILFIPGRMMQGNKNSGAMTQLDALLLGIASGLGALPGISGIGSMTALSVGRGADRQQALSWAMMLSIPALLLLSCFDFVRIFAVGSAIPFWSSFFTYLLSAIGAFLGGYGGIKLAKLLMARVGFSGFAYYAWGASLLSFLLYLCAV